MPRCSTSNRRHLDRTLAVLGTFAAELGAAGAESFACPQETGQVLGGGSPLLAALAHSEAWLRRSASAAMASTQSIRVTPEVGALKRLAEAQAQQRHEPLSTLHLLAALAVHPGPTQVLLAERGLGADAILSAKRKRTEERAEACERAWDRARDVASRMGVAGVTGAHLLVALLADGSSLARQAVEDRGLDVARLRRLAWNLGLGYVSRQRLRQSAHKTAPLTPSREASPRRPSPSGVTIPLFPPASKGSGTKSPSSLQAARVIPLMVPSTKSTPGSAKTPKGPEHPLKLDSADSTAAGAAPLPTTPDPRSGSGSPAETRARAPHPRGCDDLWRRGGSATAGASRRGRRHDGRRFDLDPKRYPTLNAFGVNLTSLAARGELEPVVGRDREVEHILDVLAKRHGNNPCLVGPSGVGKTSIVRALALRIAKDQGRPSPDDRIIVEVSLSELVAGTGVRGALAQRFLALQEEAKSAAGRAVVFFDEIHQLFMGEGSDEIAADLKRALARGELPCVGTTSAEDYRRFIASDSALARRFTRVDVEEPSREDAFFIVEAVSLKLAQHHRVTYTEDALALSIGWTARYLPERVLPDKAIAVADAAGARVRRRGGTRVDEQAIAEVVTELANVPLERLLQTDGDRLLGLERSIANRVVGHSAAIGKVCSILRRNAAGLGSRRRPIGTFLLLGPTGVGKTETVKAVAEALFHSDSAMTRLDMAEFSEPHAVARLIGAPPGYIGHDAGGQLTESVRRRPYQVILLDEIEKAHPDVLQSFLALFDEGRLTDGKGRTVDFTNVVVFMTSNIGAEHSGSAPQRRVGFGNDRAPDHRDAARGVTAAARAKLSPELFNRIDEVAFFAPLDQKEIREIARHMLKDLVNSLAERGVDLRVGDEVVNYLLAHGGYDLSLGARPMKRTMARLIEGPLAEKILSTEVLTGTRLSVEATEEGLKFELLDSKSSRQIASS